MKSNKGTTLVEMLVTIVLCSIFFMIIGFFFQRTFTLWFSGHENIAQNSNLDFFQKKLSYAFRYKKADISWNSTAASVQYGYPEMTFHDAENHVVTLKLTGPGPAKVLQYKKGSIIENILDNVTILGFRPVGGDSNSDPSVIEVYVEQEFFNIPLQNTTTISRKFTIMSRNSV
jgi:hypothetical protein